MRTVLAAAAASLILLVAPAAAAAGDYGDGRYSDDYGPIYGYDDGCRFCTLNGWDPDDDYSYAFDYGARDVSGYRPYSDTGLSGSGHSGGYYATYPETY